MLLSRNIFHSFTVIGSSKVILLDSKISLPLFLITSFTNSIDFLELIWYNSLRRDFYEKRDNKYFIIYINKKEK